MGHELILYNNKTYLKSYQMTQMLLVLPTEITYQLDYERKTVCRYTFCVMMLDAILAG